MSAAWRGDGGGRVGEKHLLNRSNSRRGLLGTQKHSGSSLPSGPTEKSTLAAGCQAQGAAVPHSGSLAPGSSPAIYSAAALHPLCFVRAAQVAACGQGFQHPPQHGGSVINVKRPLSPFPLQLLQHLQFLLKIHTSLTL